MNKDLIERLNYLIEECEAFQISTGECEEEYFTADMVLLKDILTALSHVMPDEVANDVAVLRDMATGKDYHLGHDIGNTADTLERLQREREIAVNDVVSAEQKARDLEQRIEELDEKASSFEGSFNSALKDIARLKSQRDQLAEALDNAEEHLRISEVQIVEQFAKNQINIAIQKLQKRRIMGEK